MNGKIRDAVAQLAGTHLKDEVYMTVCTVTAVDEPTRTCTCTTITGNASTDLQDVQLMAEVDDGMLLLPSVGSTVIVGYSKRNAPYVALYSQIDKVVVITGNSSVTQTTDSIIVANNNTQLTISDGSFVAKKENTTFTLNENGYRLQANEKSLANVMQNLLQQIMAMTMETPAGTSSIPTNNSQFQIILNDLNNILI